MTSRSGDDETLARFREIIGDFDPDQIHDLLGQLMGPASFAARRAQRPDLRRPAPDRRQVLTVRVDLQDASPPIWRRLELRSDLSLESVHDVLQVAFGWAGYHLWRFSSGGHPFDLDAQLFLCPFDMEDGEEQGLAASAVRLGELLQERGDELGYVYDYGDDWDLRIVVESVRDAPADAAPARATGGRRAAPPEDCGGLRTAEDLAEVLEDPARFDVKELDRELFAGPPPLEDPNLQHRVPAVLADLLARLGRSQAGRELTRRVALLHGEPAEEVQEWDRALRAVTWFLDQADQEGGIPLTAAGYMRPAAVEAASAVVPAMADWIGTKNREVQSVPLLDFRESLQRAGILRKYKGALLLSRRARTAFHAGQVRELLRETLVPAPGGFEHVGSVLLLTHVATTTPGDAVELGELTRAATELGWNVDGGPVPTGAFLDLPAWDLLSNIGERTGSRSARRWSFSPEAAALAREALRR